MSKNEYERIPIYTKNVDQMKNSIKSMINTSYDLSNKVINDIRTYIFNKLDTITPDDVKKDLLNDIHPNRKYTFYNLLNDYFWSQNIDTKFYDSTADSVKIIIKNPSDKNNKGLQVSSYFKVEPDYIKGQLITIDNNNYLLGAMREFKEELGIDIIFNDNYTFELKQLNIVGTFTVSEEKRKRKITSIHIDMNNNDYNKLKEYIVWKNTNDIDKVDTNEVTAIYM
jgi:hypothetical protein